MLKFSLTLASILVLSLGTNGLAAQQEHLDRLLKTNQCANCDLRGADLRDRNFFGANLVNANLEGANLEGTNLGSANLTDANLQNANLQKAYLYQATLHQTNLAKANLTNAYLREALISEINLQGAILRGVNLSRVNLIGVNLEGADLREANLTYTLFSGINAAKFPPSPDFFLGGISIPNLFNYQFCHNPSSQNIPPLFDNQFSGLGVDLSNLAGANLENANLTRAVLVGANLRNANLKNANLTQTCLPYSRLTNALLDGANLEKAILKAAVLQNTSVNNVQNADFSETYASEREAELAPYQADALSYVASMNRSQQAFYAEYSRFSDNLDSILIHVVESNEFYEYQINLSNPKVSLNMARARQDGLRSYTGAAFLKVNPQYEDLTTTFTIICETEKPSQVPPSTPTFNEETETIQCPPGSREVKNN